MNAQLESCVYSQLRSPRELIGLEDQRTLLTNLISTAIREQQSTSILCLGRPGTGKASCINAVLSNLTKAMPGALLVVRLTGLLHAQPHIGLREALDQLGEQTNDDDDDDDDDKKKKRMPQDDFVNSLIARIQCIAKREKALVFCLSNLEHFAAQPRQVLLYSLLELTTTSAAIVVLGITSAFDVLDQLEKRVKSRFTQRPHVIFLGPQTIDDVIRISKAALLVADETIQGAGEWNAACIKLLSSAEASTVLQQHLQHTNDVRHLLNLLVRLEEFMVI